MPLRIGLHMGDIVFDGTEIYGDGVNIASRIEGQTRVLAADILVSDIVRRLVDQEKLPYPVAFQSQGMVTMKGKSEALELFSVVASSAPQSP